MANESGDRLTRPMVRTCAKGNGFREISWDKVIDLMAERRAKTIARYTSRASPSTTVGNRF